MSLIVYVYVECDYDNHLSGCGSDSSGHRQKLHLGQSCWSPRRATSSATAKFPAQWPGFTVFQALELYLSTIVIFMLKVSKKVSCVIAVRWLCLITHLHFLHLKFPWKHLCVSHVYIHTRTHTYIYMYSYHISRSVLIHLHNICIMCSYRMHMLYSTVC